MRVILHGFMLVTVTLSVLLTPQEVRAQASTVRHDSVEVNGIRLHYRVAGSGPTVLLLHGFTGAGAWWNPLFEGLAKDYTTIVPDLPGHGSSQGRDGPDLRSRVASGG